MVYDVIIIGAGPAGVTAAVYLKRADINVLVLYKDSGSLGYSTIDNMYSYGSIKGSDLFEKGLDQLKENDIEVIKTEVLSINQMEDFNVFTVGGEFHSKNIIIASGINKSLLKPMYQKYLGFGVSTCAFCDGPFFKKKKVWVTGKSPYLENLINELKYFTQDIEVIDEDSIVSLIGDENLERILLKDGSIIDVTNLFVALPLGASSLSSNLGVMTDSKNNIKVDENMRTNIPHVYAVGDCIDGVRQVSKAMYDGMRAAYALIKEIKG